MNTPTQTDPLPFLAWDTYDITQHQAEFLVENGEAINDDEGFAMACQDSELLTIEWESLTACLTETLQKINPDGYWQAEVVNFGWRKQSGCAHFKAEDGADFLSHSLPNTDCSFRLFLDEDGTIRIQNFHHDAPTGNEWYSIRPEPHTHHQVA
jgi:hypothetical protein